MSPFFANPHFLPLSQPSLAAPVPEMSFVFFSMQTTCRDITRDMSRHIPDIPGKNSSNRSCEGPFWYVSTYVDTNPKKRHYGCHTGNVGDNVTTSTTFATLRATCRGKVQLSRNGALYIWSPAQKIFIKTYTFTSLTSVLAVLSKKKGLKKG